jgi:hypothetical protein
MAEKPTGPFRHEIQPAVTGNSKIAEERGLLPSRRNLLISGAGIIAASAVSGAAIAAETQAVNP